MVGIVEGFEEDICRIEVEGQMRNVPRSQVDKEVRQGDIVEWKSGLWLTNLQKTEARSKEIKRLMEDVWED
ncbi:DUF3006 domain-containing protein [Paenibacillus lutimineralis]|uniref:DUF3006 domain-containing protein n=1 Tax=Paenibacillus lutimineralis TaxID=2707005 RepID=A0A3Q9IA39_9BACL|nr:DUF3006 domain-containing protein [Paenibacillus lutimineralis]AZS14546.1 DUF3006 domain-containing protein [Paenibacillus lutimineralis]